ncbi:helix-turn-helix domain-containing protein [Sinorhizobium medicae]
MNYQPLAEVRIPSAAENAARRIRLMGKPIAPRLALVRAEHVVIPPKAKINAGGRPRKQKPRPDADDHVYAYKLHLLKRKRRLSPTDHAKMRCLEARIPFETLRSPTRSRRLVPLRNLIAWELRQRGLSYPQIGHVLNRDHTAMIHSVRRIEAQKGDPGAIAWVKRKDRQLRESLRRQIQRKKAKAV